MTEKGHVFDFQAIEKDGEAYRTTNEIKVLKNIVYHVNEHEVHTCDVYLPNSGKQDYPVVFFVHGGSFHTGSKEMYQEWGAFIAEHDMVAIALNYTLATPNRPGYPHVLQDLNAAIKFVVQKAHEWQIDTYNMGFIGDSAGGYLASLAAFKLSGSSFKIKAVVPVYGVFDLMEWDEYTEKTRTDKVVKKFLGATQELNPTLYRQASIFNMVEQAVCDPHFHAKFLIVCGELDDVVLVKKQSYPFMELLSQYDVDYELLSIKDRGHFWFTPINENKLLETYPTDIATERVLTFLKKCFKDKNTYDIHLYEV